MRGGKKKVSLLHSQSGLALVLSLLLLMVINYYYPATRSTADVMSPMSLGQREKKKSGGCPSRGGSGGGGGSRRGLPLSPFSGVLAAALAGIRCQPGSAGFDPGVPPSAATAARARGAGLSGEKTQISTGPGSNWPRCLSPQTSGDV